MFFSASGARRAWASSAVRLAPRKAKTATSTAPAASQNPDANHLFNIYANTPDHEIGPDADYPSWVHLLGKKKLPSYGQLEMKFVHGKVGLILLNFNIN